MTNTPKTNQTLAEILKRDGELSEDNAPAVLVKLCRKMERERNEWKEKAESLLQALAATQDAIGCGCGGDYGLCDDCSAAYNKTDELIKARETNQPKP